MPQPPEEPSKIIIRPRGGLNLNKVSTITIGTAVIEASGLLEEQAHEDVCPNFIEDIIVVSTPKPDHAATCVRIKSFKIMETIYEALVTLVVYYVVAMPSAIPPLTVSLTESPAQHYRLEETTTDQTNATRAQGQNPSEERGEPSCSAIAVRLPQYWDQHPSAWFLQAEAQFQVAGIRSQASKFHYAVAPLSPAAIDEVADLLNSPLSAATYDDLKAALLQRTAASERSRIQQLLSAEELGDQRPSQLLRRMSQLLGNNARSIDDTLLRELFLQRLPADVQMVLATASTLDLTGLAALADKVMEVATPTIAATSPGTSPQISSPTSRSSSRSRRAGTRNETSTITHGVCYYHRRFGNDTRHCRRPCAWQGNRPADL
ncbi:uncharacterized protein [Dermacentor andersoni]|uniref:uncharacterized protein n=1 Tax=Dermacentor andersoni TaxID=34620 RepID=UPI003B3BDF6E